MMGGEGCRCCEGDLDGPSMGRFRAMQQRPWSVRPCVQVLVQQPALTDEGLQWRVCRVQTCWSAGPGRASFEAAQAGRAGQDRAAQGSAGSHWQSLAGGV